ncbi:MAG: hypothetical protein MUF25_09320 [Pirellulaceae bacterium]|nr:hypothetical protein [Pirellulaceae bacterium]
MLHRIESDDRMGKGTGTGGDNAIGFVRGARPLLLVACVVAWTVSVAAGPVYGQDVKLWPDGAPGAKGTDQNDTVRDLAGWKVYVHHSLLPGGEHAATGAEALQRLTDGMLRLKTWIPAGPLAKLLEVKIWFELDSTNGPWGGTSGYQYHPGRDWLLDMDFNPDKHKCVEFGNAASLAKRSPDETAGVLLHELAHAYHDQVLTFQDPDVLAAYQRCVEGTAYPERDWVKSDHKRFFAGVTTRYFGRKEEREAVGRRDPVLEEFLQKTWGLPNATMDTPWEGPQAMNSPIAISRPACSRSGGSSTATETRT